MGELTGKKFAVLIENLFNEYEFIYPYYRLQEAGASVVIAGNTATEHKGEYGMTVSIESAIADLGVSQLDGIVIAGGYGPDKMRTNQACLDLIRNMNEEKKIIAFICHAGWVPISAGILKGRQATSVDAIKDDMVNAGCQWQNRAVVVDGHLISSRSPRDLPQFAAAIVNWYAQ